MDTRDESQFGHLQQPLVDSLIGELALISDHVHLGSLRLCRGICALWNESREHSTVTARLRWGEVVLRGETNGHMADVARCTKRR